jgi:hypothetical protein
MKRAAETEFVDIVVNNTGRGGAPDETRGQLSLTVSSNQSVRDVLQLASARLCPPRLRAPSQRERTSLQIRREGEILSLDPEALVGDALRNEDRLILEVVAGGGRLTSDLEPSDSIASDRMTSVEEGGPAGAFGSAAARIAGRAISADSAAFLDRARNPAGE